VERVLIAGCGDVGGELGRRLVADGHRVFGLRRNAAALPPEVEPVAADLGVPASLAAVPEAVSLLVYSAAADGFSDEAYQRAYVSGVRNVLDALSDHPLRRVLFVSSTGVYGQDDGGWVDEGSPTEPAGFSGRRLLEGERLVARCGAPSVSVRFGGIYGPGRTRLIDRVRAGATCSESPVTWTNRIHRDDCAGVLRHLAWLDDPAPVYVGVDCEPAAQCEVLDWLASAIGAPRPRRAPGARRGRGGNKRCSNRRLLASGYRFAYPSYREGYGAMLAAS
jgi:nucleoside-diphosphate-sugar epimerase